MVAKKSKSKNKKAKFRLAFPSFKTIGKVLSWPFVTPYKKLIKQRNESPHKSFIRTKKRDKIAKPKIEGYLTFPWYVSKTLWSNKWVYIRFVVAFLVLSTLFIGALQVDNITSVNSVIDSANSGTNIFGPTFRAFVTVGSSISGALNSNLSDVQYIYLSALAILAMLTIVWLLRHQLAGKKVKVRDGLYSAAASIAAQYVLVGVGLLQLIPAALVTLVYLTATSAGLLDGGIETAMFSLAIVLTIVLTLYFMTTTLFAMFIATLPGTYPMKAYKIARKIVAGQRFRLVMRLFWMVVILLFAWFIVLVPVVIIVNAFGAGNSWVIPVTYQLTMVASVVYATAYAYLLYRRMIDEPVAEK